MAKDIEVYTLTELIDLLQVTRRSLYNWIKDGKIKAFRVGREWRVTKQSLKEFMEASGNDYKGL